MDLRSRLAVLLATVLVVAVAVPAADAATMTLESVTVDDTMLLGPDTDWTVPRDGGKVTWTTQTWTGTYDFPMPATIPAAGASFDITLKAESRKNSADQHTRFSPRMSVRGDIVSPGRRVDHGADADSATLPTDERTAKVTLTPIAARSVVTVGIQDGPVYTYTYRGEADALPPPSAPPVETATVVSTRGEVVFRIRGGPWQPLRPGARLQDDAEVFTGIDSNVRLTFADGTTIDLEELTQIAIVLLAREEDRMTVKLQLALGKIKSQHVREKLLDTNFEIQAPHTAGHAPRGTVFTLFHDAVSRATIVSTIQGSVFVDPVAVALPSTMVPAGRELEVTSTTISPLAVTGQAGARGGANRERARALVLDRIDRSASRCRLTIPRSPSAVAIQRAARGWLVSVTVRGRAKGKSSWSVTSGKATPRNRLAKRIARSCR